MMKTRWIAILLLIFIFSCRDKYIIPQVAPATGYLVVEGNINAGNDTTVIFLSRSSTLTASGRTYEDGATVSVEGKDGSLFNLNNAGQGTYTINQLNVSNAQTYRLHIKTSNGKEYVSDYVAVKTTPPIDSVSWIRENEGLRIYVNAHDDAAQTRYYLWGYQETWEIHSAYSSVLEYDLSNRDRPGIKWINTLTHEPVESIYKCWVNRNSTSLALGSTAKLTTDRIYLPLVYLPNASRELSVLYSINVKQYALSKDAYEYLDKMRKNTESTGSIFDPQPSALSGNIHAVTDPAETVIGFVNISSAQQKRKWISSNEVLSWGYTSGCVTHEIQNKTDSIKAAISSGYIPTTVAAELPPGTITSFYTTERITCIDCRLSGSNIKPSYWP
jgi:hypothetical protein